MSDIFCQIFQLYIMYQYELPSRIWNKFSYCMMCMYLYHRLGLGLQYHNQEWCTTISFFKFKLEILYILQSIITEFIDRLIFLYLILIILSYKKFTCTESSLLSLDLDFTIYVKIHNLYKTYDCNFGIQMIQF